MSCDETISIHVQNISKYFEMYSRPSHRLWQMLFHGRKKFFKEYWALNDISFDIKKGECVGIIGRNGAGKSTLLQIITGILTPSSGNVLIHGRVAALLELGSGFNPEFSGKENVYLNASILGLSEKEIAERYDAIVDFADIGEFIDQPVKSYSSGMVVRLAFAVIAHVDPEILIIDEALAVGDAFFTQKCMRFLRQFMEKNTVLFVSHDTAAVNSLCNRAILLDKGHVEMIGSPRDVTDRYLEALYESMQGKSATPTEEKAVHALVSEDYRDMRQDIINASTIRNDIEVFQFKEDAAGFGKGGAQITMVQLTDENDRPLLWIIGGEKVKVKVQCTACKDLFSPIVGFMVRDRLGQNIFGDNTYLTYNEHPLRIPSGTTFIATFVFRMPILSGGDYFMNAAIAEGTQDNHTQHHWVHEALMFQSHVTSCCNGIVGIPMQQIHIQTI